MGQNTCEIIPYFHSSPFDYTYLLHCNLRDYTVYSRNCEKINNVQRLKKLPTCLPYLHVISVVYLFCLFTCFFRALLYIIIPFTLKIFCPEINFWHCYNSKAIFLLPKRMKTAQKHCKSSTFSNLFDRL